jgi:hypothetical protein
MLLILREFLSGKGFFWQFEDNLPLAGLRDFHYAPRPTFLPP